VPQQLDSENIHLRQLEAIARKEKELEYQHLSDVADQAVAISRRTLDYYLRICRLVSPELVKEIEEKYRGVSLDEREPVEELTINITGAVNLLLLAAASAKINVEDALRKLHEENMTLNAQLKQSTQSIHQLQRENAYLRNALETHEQQKRNDKGKAPGRNSARTYETRRTGQALAAEVEGPPDDTGGSEQEEVPGKANGTPIKSIHIDTGRDEMELSAALATWMEIASNWTDKKKGMYYPLIEIIGTGMVKKAEIQAKVAKDYGVDEKTVERQLNDLTKEPVLLKAREYTIGENGRPGRKPAAYELTPVGKAAYRSLTGQIEALPDDVVLTKAHKDPDHADLVKRTASALTRLGFAASPNNSPIPLEDGAMFDPDIKVTGPDMKVFFVEAESPAHVKYKDLHTKWMLATRVNGNKIYLVMRSHADAESLGYSIIRHWAEGVHYPDAITVYLSGLDTLESMPKPPKGAVVNPWAKTKTIWPTDQTELIP
jgi:hypothetical protein